MKYERRSRRQRPPLGRPERRGGPASNTTVNVSDGRRTASCRPGGELREIIAKVQKAIDPDGLVTVVADGKEKRLWPVDAVEQIGNGTAVLKGSE